MPGVGGWRNVLRPGQIFKICQDRIEKAGAAAEQCGMTFEECGMVFEGRGMTFRGSAL